MTRSRRVLRALGVVLLTTLALLVLAGLGGGVWVSTPPGNAWLLDTLLRLAAPARGTLTAGGLRTDLLSGLTLTDVTLADGDGRSVIEIHELGLDYSLGGILGRKLLVRSATAEGITVNLRHEDGTCHSPLEQWDLPPSKGGPWTGLGVDIDLASLDLRADTITVCTGTSPLVASAITLSGAARAKGPTLSSSGLTLDGVLTADFLTAPVPMALSATGSWDGKAAHIDALDATLGTQHLEATANLSGLDSDTALLSGHIADAHFEPELFGIPGIHGPVSATGDVKGRLAHPVFLLDLTTNGGAAHAEGDVDFVPAVPVWNLDLQLPTDLQLAETIDALTDTRVAGRITAAGKGFSWPALQVDGTVDLAAAAIEGKGPYKLTGAVHLLDGIVDAPAAQVVTPVGAGTITARIDVLTGAALATVETDIDLAGLVTYGVPGLRGLVHYSGAVSGDWATGQTADPANPGKDGLRATADGSIRAGPVAYQDATSFGSLAGPVHVAWAGDRGFVDSVLATTDVRAPASDSAVVAAAGSVTVALTFGTGGVSGRLDSRLTDTTVPWQHFDLLLLNALLTPDHVAFAAIGGGPAPETDPTGLPDAETLAAQGAYTFASRPGGRSTLSVDAARYSPAEGVDVRLLDPATVIFTNDGFIVHARAAQDQGTLTADGTLSTRGDCDLTVSLADFPLATINAFDPGATWGGVASADVHLSGPLRAPVSTFTARAEHMVAPGLLQSGNLDIAGSTDRGTLSVNATLQTSTGARRMVRAEARVGLQPKGDLPSLDPAAPLWLDVVVPPSSSEDWRDLLDPAFLPATSPAFRAAAQLVLAGTLRAPTATFTIGTRVQTPDGWVTLDGDADVVDDVATLRLLANQQLVRRAQVTGTLGLGLSRLTAMATGAPAPASRSLLSDLALDLVPLQLPLTSLGAPPEVTGNLLGGLHVSGDPTFPKVEGALLVINGAIGDVPVSSAMLTLTGAEGGYDIDAQIGFGRAGGGGGRGAGEGAGSVHAAGFVPVEANLEALDSEFARTGLHIVVDGDGIPLEAASALIPGLTEADGMARLTGTIEGQANAPIPNLTLIVNGGSFAVEPLNVRYTDVQIEARLLPGSIDLVKLEAQTSPRSRDRALTRPGTLSASGRIALDHFEPGAVRGALAFDNAWIANRPDVTLQATSVLRVSGTWPVLSIGGKVDVDIADVVLRESFFTAESSLQLDGDIAVIREGVAAPVKAEAGLPLDLNLDVQVFLNRHADIDVTIPMEQFGGELTKSLSNLRFDVTLDSPEGLRLQRRGGVVQLAGVVEPLSGVANVLGKDFEIAGGTISFTGVDYLTPLLNLGAAYDSGANGTITAHISGAATSPSISFSSDQGKSTDDMISILLFGAPIGDLQESSQSQAAIAAAFQSVFKSQLNEAASLTRLDVVAFSSDSYTFGKRFGKDVMVEVVINPPNETTSTTVHKNPVELHIELPLWKGWYLAGMGGTAGIGKVSAYSRWRF